MTAARILADSISESGDRLTTFELTFPRYVLAEFNTHRVLARNSASSRAIPVAKRIAAVREQPFVPVFGKNQPGMQAHEVLQDERAENIWRSAARAAVVFAEQMEAIGVHKQVANRILEPFAMHTVIATGTAWENFFEQRSQHHTDMADPAISEMATMAEDCYRESKPIELFAGEWFTPLFGEFGGVCEDYGEAAALAVAHGCTEEDIAKRVSTARCARVSYLTHDGVRDMHKDLELYEETLANFGHWSPLEHVATPCGHHRHDEHRGCFQGWDQFRHQVESDRGLDTYR